MHTHYRVFLCTVLLPVLSTLILCGLLPHKIVGKVYYYYYYCNCNLINDLGTWCAQCGPAGGRGTPESVAMNMQTKIARNGFASASRMAAVSRRLMCYSRQSSHQTSAFCSWPRSTDDSLCRYCDLKHTIYRLHLPVLVARSFFIPEHTPPYKCL